MASFQPWIKPIKEGDMVSYKGKLGIVFKVEPVALTQTGGTFNIYHLFLIDSDEKVRAQRKEITENGIGEDLTSEWDMEIDPDDDPEELNTEASTSRGLDTEEPTEHATGTSRFPEMTASDVARIANDSVSNNTKAKEKWAVTILKGENKITLTLVYSKAIHVVLFTFPCRFP